MGVQKGTTGKDLAEENLARSGVEIKTFDAAPDAFTDLEAGNIVRSSTTKGSSIGEIAEASGWRSSRRSTPRRSTVLRSPRTTPS